MKNTLFTKPIIANYRFDDDVIINETDVNFSRAFLFVEDKSHVLDCFTRILIVDKKSLLSSCFMINFLIKI
jgi:hypothetical protein